MQKNVYEETKRKILKVAQMMFFYFYFVGQIMFN